ncbi:MAG: hypothetical protein M3O50_09420, partial [Myxococcota bacterium]|nr:hypothetical protein [Myxococcota bacterium]
ESLRVGQRLAPDSPRELGAREMSRESRDGREGRDLLGYALQATVRTGEGPPAPKGPEVNTAVIEGARRKTEPHVAIELSQTRARFVLSGGFVVPQGTELRARVDHYGHLVLWPGELTYRIAEPGALRALLGERRMDVAPLSRAEVRLGGDGARRLNLSTRRVDVSTRAAKGSLELATVRDAGDGAVLVCRFLLDLMNAPPSTAPCATDEIPLHAELRWTTQGALTFDVTSIVRRNDLAPADLAGPPASAAFESAAPTAESAELLVSRAELAAFRSGPVDVPQTAPRDAQAPLPETGLTLVNWTDELRLVWIDGVAVAWVGPGKRVTLASLVRGRYSLEWRTFLGDSWEPPVTVIAPGVSEVGVADVATR